MSCSGERRLPSYLDIDRDIAITYSTAHNVGCSFCFINEGDRKDEENSVVERDDDRSVDAPF